MRVTLTKLRPAASKALPTLKSASVALGAKRNRVTSREIVFTVTVSTPDLLKKSLKSHRALLERALYLKMMALVPEPKVIKKAATKKAGAKPAAKKKAAYGSAYSVGWSTPRSSPAIGETRPPPPGGRKPRI
jgi:hypothetical protein